MIANYTYNESYRSKIVKTLDNAMQSHKRTTSLRVDLRLPDGQMDAGFQSSLMTRFFESLKAKIDCDLRHKEGEWCRGLSCSLKYVWVREFGPISGKKHFHVLLFVNKDVYHALGDFSKTSGNLSAMIRQAWCSALGLPFPRHQQLAHFPAQGLVYLDSNHADFVQQRQQVLERADYLAKEATKLYGDGERSFGCSR